MFFERPPRLVPLIQCGQFTYKTGDATRQRQASTLPLAIQTVPRDMLVGQ